MSWTQHTPHRKDRTSGFFAGRSSEPSLTHDTENLPTVGDDALALIQSESADEINALSTSALAPILNSARSRLRLAPLTCFFCFGLFVFALSRGNDLSLNIALLFAAVFIPCSLFLDRYRRSVRVEYKLEGPGRVVAEALAKSFSELKASSLVWSIQAQGATSDWKRNAGATRLNRRKAISPDFLKPSCIRGSVSFPAIPTKNEELYFLPDAVLLLKGHSVAALSYGDLSVSYGQVRFIEGERVPADASFVGETWRFVNKSGGPDRRFGNNKRLPICLYGEISFGSRSGLNVKVHLSNPTASRNFVDVLDVLKKSGVQSSKPFSAFQNANVWPTIAFSISVLLAGAFASQTDRLRPNQAISTAQSANLVTSSIPTTSSRAAPSPIQTTPRDLKSPQQQKNAQPLNILPTHTVASAPVAQRKLVDVPLPRPKPVARK